MNKDTLVSLKSEQIYEAIRQRFDSKLTCGPGRDEAWWDWLAVWLPAQLRELVEKTSQLD